MKFVFLVALCLAASYYAQPQGDLITSLPYFSGDLGTQYSGYVCIDETKGEYFHYMFVQSENDPANDPLVLWMNGGPGCSSLDGYFYEQGPLHFNQNNETDLTLEVNPWAWSKIANMLFLEAPLGVGFSYSNDQGDYNTDDNITAANNYKFLKAWFEEFPMYKNSPFWISGESYAGIYVPTLADWVRQDSSINFQGVLVGNGVSDQNYDSDFTSLFPFLYGHGFFGDRLWNTFQEYCILHYDDDKCSDAQNDIYNQLNDINIYNVYGTCYPQRPVQTASPFLKKLLAKGVGVVPPCVDASKATTYLNMASVTDALHVKGDITWAICTDQINYNSIIDSTLPYYVELMKQGKQILIYSGDTDGAVPYRGTELWTSSLNLTLNNDWRQWFMDTDFGSQVAGFVTEYQGLTFATIKGAGHMVPQYAPEAAFYMFKRFISGNPL